MEQSSIKNEAAVGEAEGVIGDVGVNKSGAHISITLCMNCNVLFVSTPLLPV